MPTVRTTIQPHVEITVSDAEYIDLDRMGLLVQTSKTQPSATSPAAAPAPTTPSGKSSKE